MGVAGPHSGDEQQCQHHRDRPDWHVDEEDPAPVEVGENNTAHDRAEHRCGAHDRAEDTERPPAQPRRKDRHD